jgi:hypothetical protein
MSPQQSVACFLEGAIWFVLVLTGGVCLITLGQMTVYRLTDWFIHRHERRKNRWADTLKSAIDLESEMQSQIGNRAEK